MLKALSGNGILDAVDPGTMEEARVTAEDREDIAASLAGDEAAYARLVTRYQNRVGRWMWRFSRDRSTQAELTQEVFVEAYYSLASFEGRAAFATWLGKIATRVGYHYWQREKREREHRRALAEWRPNDDDAGPSEAAQELFSLLSRLPVKDRLVLTLHYFEDLDVRAIAERTGWSVSLVKVRLFRARNKLRGLLEERNRTDEH